MNRFFNTGEKDGNELQEPLRLECKEDGSLHRREEQG